MKVKPQEMGEVVNIRQAYIAMIKAYEGGWDAMAGALGMRHDALENRIYERKGQDLHVHTALQMQKFSRTTFFAEAVASASGGTFVLLPSLDHIDNESIADKFHELYAELGELSVEFQTATKDGEVDKKERQRINCVVDRMHKTMDELRALTFKFYCRETAAKAGDRKHG
ncbi:YmfL family putative regulatory protein [Undibacterium sp. Ji42W]|uniref:YmfL family putative regulatory protein n=1 Tax=Undibacterium sp. Ji42W TaxID=3413039 RepID=UPI003BF2A436